jgi:hypothetical protein
MSGAYLYFSGDLNSKNIVPVAYGGSLSSSLGFGLASISSGLEEKIASDISFLETLVSLKRINIDDTLFTDKYFNLLKNNTVKIDPVIPGRSNPFAPIEKNIEDTNSPADVVTDQPTQITDKTVVLNGTINIINGVGDTYFEYGTTENLGITISTIKPTLVGVFMKNISGLIPKTTYFFKACAKINNIKTCGNLISFKTN